VSDTVQTKSVDLHNLSILIPKTGTGEDDFQDVLDTEDDRSERRIAACLLACKGIPTRSLEEGAIYRLIAACIHIGDERIRDALNAFSALQPRREGGASRRKPAAGKP
jgi:hypothetical protein